MSGKKEDEGVFINLIRCRSRDIFQAFGRHQSEAATKGNTWRSMDGPMTELHTTTVPAWDDPSLELLKKKPSQYQSSCVCVLPIYCEWFWLDFSRCVEIFMENLSRGVYLFRRDKKDNMACFSRSITVMENSLLDLSSNQLGWNLDSLH